MFVVFALLATVTLATAGTYPSGAYTFATGAGSPYCDGITFSVTGHIMSGLHTGSCLGGTYPVSGNWGIVSKYAPEVSSDPDPVVFDSGDTNLQSIGLQGFYVVDTQNLVWALYSNSGGGTSLQNSGLLLKGAPPAKINGTLSYRDPNAVSKQLPPGSGFTFTFSGYCDGMSLTISSGITTGSHLGSCVAGPWPTEGGANTTDVAPETVKEPAYTITDSAYLATLNTDLGFWILDVTRKTWSVWMNENGAVTLINEGTLTNGAPPAQVGGRPAAFKQY